MRKTFSATAIAAAIALLSSVAAHAQSVPVSSDETSRFWFVELSGAPIADGRLASAVRADKEAFRSAARAAGIRWSERKTFDTLFNGFSIQVHPADRAKLLTLPGVKAIYPVLTVPAPTAPEAAENAANLAAALSLTGADVAQSKLGLSGAGVKVGIIDTGIDIDHPAFGGSGTPGTTPFPTARVIAGYDFVGDNYNSSGSADQQIPVPDAIPDDCAGHGTHVAGIVGANGGGLIGVAPKVSFGAYRVFGCTGTSDSDVIMAAMERALADGMQVVNQSLGAARQWPEYPTAKAATRLVNKGVVMVASIGNSGPTGSSPDALFAAGAPGVGDKVIGVASYDNAQGSFSVNGTPYGYNPATGSPLPPTSGSIVMAKSGTTTTADDLCTARPAGTWTGQAVLVRRGTCSFYIKATNAQAAGAGAVVLYNNAAGALNPTVAGTPAVTIPVVAITAAQGATLDAAITAGTTTLNWSSNFVAYPYGTGGLISGFSSFGLTAELDLKPQIGAPGGTILSSYPLELGGTAVLSGTSMSSPHVAGAVALMLEANPGLRPAQIQTLIQNTADPKLWSGNPGTNLLDHTHRQGAGMLDIVGAIQSAATVTPSQISVGEVVSGTKTYTLTVDNKTGAPANYAISYVPAVATGPNTTSGSSYNLTGFYAPTTPVSFSTTNLNVPARGKTSFSVTIGADATLPDRSIYGGYVVLTPSNGAPPLRVPFAGFKGDYQSTQVLLPTASGFPWLASLAGTTYTNQPGGATFTMADSNNIPYLLMHLDHLSRQLKVEAFDAVSGKSWNLIDFEEYVTRNSTPTGFFSWAWDGTTFKGKPDNPRGVQTVPNGQYVLKVSVLKALGDPNVTADWETWTSPVITIARP